MWGYHTNHRLVGKPVIATKFKSRAKAFKTCMKIKSCKGVNQIGKLNSSTNINNLESHNPSDQ